MELGLRNPHIASNPGVMLLRLSIIPFIFGFVVVSLYTKRHGHSAPGLDPVPYGATGVAENWLFTIHFAAYFVVGLLLAKAATERADWLCNMQGWQKAVLILIGGPLLFIFRDATGAIGAAMVIILAINSSAFQTFLRKPFLSWLGRISFSLYLTHTIVLQIVVRLLHQYVPLSLSLVATLILIFPIAALFFRFVEMPAIQLSRWIGRRETPADTVADRRG